MGLAVKALPCFAQKSVLTQFHVRATPGPLYSLFVQSEDSLGATHLVHRFNRQIGSEKMRAVWSERIELTPDAENRIEDLWVDADSSVFLVGTSTPTKGSNVKRNFVYRTSSQADASVVREPIYLPTECEVVENRGERLRIEYARIIGGPEGSKYLISRPFPMDANEPVKMNRKFAVLKLDRGLAPVRDFGRRGRLIVDTMDRFGNAEELWISGASVDSGVLRLAIDLLDLEVLHQGIIGTGIFEISARGQVIGWQSEHLIPYPESIQGFFKRKSNVILPNGLLLQISQKGGEEEALPRLFDFEGELTSKLPLLPRPGAMGVVDSEQSAAEALRIAPVTGRPVYVGRQKDELSVQFLTSDGRRDGPVWRIPAANRSFFPRLGGAVIEWCRSLFLFPKRPVPRTE
jgi:hypothetical protein